MSTSKALDIVEKSVHDSSESLSSPSESLSSPSRPPNSASSARPGRRPTTPLTPPAIPRHPEAQTGGHQSPPNAGGVSNRILLALPTTVRAEILRDCNSVEFAAGQLICTAGAQVHQAYFINAGLVSLIKVMRDGQSSEIAAVGSEGLLGLFASAYGADRALVNQVAQLPIHALRINRHKLQNAIAKYPELQRVTTQYLLLTTDLLEQISACNRLHSLEQRLCYWLLVMTDETHSPEMHVTHDFLASMLGVHRSSVSITANVFRTRQAVRYSHGKILVLDRNALERTACECYQARRHRIDLAYRSAGKGAWARST